MHSFVIDVVTIHSRVLRPVCRCTCDNYATYLILLSAVSLATMALYSICSLSGFTIFKCLADLFSTFPRFFIDNHGLQHNCVKGRWSNRRNPFYFLLVKKTLHLVTRHKMNVSVATKNREMDNMKDG